MEAKLRNENGTVVCERCTLARNPYSRMRGLLGRSSLAQGEGLLLQPAGSIHTAFMRFPIDAVFLDGERRVVRIAADVGPWRTAAARRSRAVLELAAGEAARVGIEPGQLLRLEVEG
jgi:uncharacterized membrane protein (UPF0127 family)